MGGACGVVLCVVVLLSCCFHLIKDCFNLVVWAVVLVVLAGLVGVVQRSTGWGCLDWVVLFVVLAELVVVEVGVCSALLVGFFQAIFGCFNLNCFVSKVWGVVLVVLSKLVDIL